MDMKLSNLSTAIVGVWQKNGSTILTACAVGGFVTTVVLTAKQAPKAKDVLNAAHEELERDDISEDEAKALKRSTAIEVAKIYAPVAISGLVTGTCIIFAHNESMRKQAALAAAYNLSETALKEYQEQTLKLIGPKKEQEVRDEVAKSELEKNPVGNNTVIITGKGTYLCYDTTSGRYFQSTIQDVKQAVNEINHRLLSEMYITLNEFYDYLKLPHIAVGDELGWSVDTPLQLSESYHSGEDGEPCMYISFLSGPSPMFREQYH